MAKKPVDPPERPVGQPLAKIDKSVVLNLARIGCTYDEIARVTGVNKSTIYRRFKSTITEGHAEMNMSIRRKQLEVAVIDGSVQMLIWLGKQNLGQRDNKEIAVTGKDGAAIQVEVSHVQDKIMGILFTDDDDEIIDGEIIDDEIINDTGTEES